MSVSFHRSNVARVEREIASLRSQDAQESTKEARARDKLGRAMRPQSGASASTFIAKARDAENASKELATIAAKRADIASKLVNKERDLTRYQDQLRTEEERDRKRSADTDRRAQLARDRRMHDLETLIKEREATIASSLSQVGRVHADAEHDVFISHASEDKEEFVRHLATALKEVGLSVWYDEFSLKVGDSLRRNIDRGLASSRFGLVVLSPHFFAKEWPQRELDGLVQRETAGETRILPIWHKVTRDEVRQFSPTLADKLALNTTMLSLSEIVAALVDVVQP